MTNIQLSIYAMAIGLCVFTGLLAWRSLFHNRAFFAFICVITVMFTCDWLMAHPATPLKSLWLIGIMASSFLVAPCALWLAQSSGLSTRPLAKRGHFAVIALGWVLLIPLATAIHWGTEFAKPGNPTSASYALFIHSTMLISAALFIGQTIAAVRTCIAFLRERSQQNLALFSAYSDRGVNSGQALGSEPGLNTLRLLALVLLANAAIALMRIFYCAMYDDFVLPLSLAIVLGQLAMVAFLALSFMHQQVGTQSEILRQQLFSSERYSHSAIPHKDHARNEPATANTHSQAIDAAPAHSQNQEFEHITENSRPKYRKSGLSPERQAAILRAIDHAMRHYQLFTRPGLSLNDLCEHIRESPHHVSQAISESEHHNFYDLINRQRVAHAAGLLITEPTSCVLDIGFACGFNAKSSFNHAFKKYQGLTPSQFRKQEAGEHSDQTMAKAQTP